MFLLPVIIPVIMGVLTVSSMPNEDTCFAPSRGPCPPSWQNLGDYCYYVTTQLFNFTKAREGCKELGGFLAVPQHEKETEFIVDLIRLGIAGAPDFGKGWINCLEDDGTWQCSEGGKLIEYRNWASDQPQNNDESCAMMQKQANGTENGKWHDNGCQHEFPAVCKKRFTPQLHV